MAGGIDWYRWHHGSVTDPKFQLVARKAGARFGDVVTVWAYLLEAASASDERGQIGAIDAEAVDCMLGAEDGTTARIMDAMQARGLHDGKRITAWEKRQPKREDDTAAERKRRQRERDHELKLAACVTAAESHTVTQGHAEVTQGHDRGEESREEQIQEAPPASRVPPADAGRQKPRGSRRCPADFAIDAEMRQFVRDALGGRVDADAELGRFKDHTFGTARSDWKATFRNWLREADARARSKPQSFMAEKQNEMAKWIKGTSLDRSTQQEYIDAAPLTLR